MANQPALAPWAGLRSGQPTWQHSQHEPSQVGSSQHEHIPITSFLESIKIRRAPGSRDGVRAVRAEYPGEHAGEIGAQRREPGYLLVDLADMLAEQRLRRAARAGPGIPDREQLADLGEAQPEPLRAPDEQQPVQVGGAVPAVIPVGPVRLRQQAGPLVVADRVRAHPGASGQLPNGQRPGGLIDCHTPTLAPGLYSKFKGRIGGAEDQASDPRAGEMAVTPLAAETAVTAERAGSIPVCCSLMAHTRAASDWSFAAPLRESCFPRM